MKVLAAALTALLLTVCVIAEPADSPAKPVPNSSFEKMKTLVGDWEGKQTENGQVVHVMTDFRMVSDGSVLMNRLKPGQPDEMITMFHLDGPRLIATHYCSAHNQPRMLAVPSTDPNVIAFVFKDATNVGPKDGHMDKVKFTLVDANHHIEEWSYLDNGKLQTGRFELTRTK